MRIFGNAEPVKVTIGGIDVTSTKYSRANSSYAHDAYYGIGTNFGSISSNGNISFDSHGYHEVVVEATYADGTVLRETRDIGVWGLLLTPKSDTSFTDGTYYVFRNSAYATTYLYDNGNYLSAEELSQPLYRSLFNIDNNGFIRNIATSDYCTGYNNVQIEASSDAGLQYQFSYSGGLFSIYYYAGYRSYYWKQTSSTTTNVSRYASGNYSWYIYEAEPVAPQAKE